MMKNDDAYGFGILKDEFQFHLEHDWMGKQVATPLGFWSFLRALDIGVSKECGQYVSALWVWVWDQEWTNS